MCPACRLVFKVPLDHDGRGVVCPACRRLLRLPVAGETVPPLVAVDVTEDEGVERLAAGVGRRTRLWHSKRRSGDAESDGLEWDRAGKRGRFGEMTMQKSLLWIAGGAILLVLSVMVVLRLASPGPGTVRTEALGEVQQPLNLGGTTGAAPTAAKAAGGEAMPQLSAEERSDKMVAGAMAMDPARTLAATEQVARRILAATSVEDMLPLIRHPKVSEPRMREWYRGKTFVKSTPQSFGGGAGMFPSGKLVSVAFEMQDFSTREMAFEQTPAGFLLDWESWAGWSELPWEEFRQARPTAGKEFRVLAKRGYYYNFGFGDNAYQCYVLTAPDHEHMLYGYTRHGTAENDTLGTEDATDTVSWVLQLRFPEAAKSSDQVIIAKVLAKGWVLDGAAREGGP